MSHKRSLKGVNPIQRVSLQRGTTAGGGICKCIPEEVRFRPSQPPETSSSLSRLKLRQRTASSCIMNISSDW